MLKNLGVCIVERMRRSRRVVRYRLLRIVRAAREARSGLGTRLLLAVCGELAARHPDPAEPLELIADGAQCTTATLGFYTKFGFKVAGVTDAQYVLLDLRGPWRDRASIERESVRT